MNGGIGGVRLESLEEPAQVSKRPLVQTPLTQVNLGSESFVSSGSSALVHVPSLEAKQSHKQARLLHADFLNSVLKDNHKSEGWFSKMMGRWDRKYSVSRFEPTPNEPKKVVKSITLPGFSSDPLQAKLAK
ncbi:hypothetical protein [Shewanella surugensis]|uniref:Uncharacterized protein n=1 Tax=Shewanella surugensis TaxID=212020 RepID=A0ABT0L7Z6_9GAMM|nr:hypothetical protein [Shewanella surugensis]MCL1123669.1 hypothetical protein [Shewanella surugensis]